MSVVAIPIPIAPYRGLEPYRFCDQTIFFEREVEAERLLRLVTMYRGSLLYGESGAGKSSLINAGFIPKAFEAGIAVERLRVQPRSGEEFVVERIPRSDDANDVLPSRLAKEAAGQQRTTFGAHAFPAAVKAAAAAGDLLLVFDQFEELLTLTSERSDEANAVVGQRGILSAIVSLLQDRSIDGLRCLFVFREDYLAKFDRLFYYCPELPDRFMRLVSPPAASLHRLLRAPFESERIPKGTWKRELSPSVVLTLQRQLAPSDEGRALSLSQVQIVALQLWRADNPENVLARSGVDGIVRDFLFEQLTAFAASRAAAEAALSQMITRQGTRKVVSESEVIDEICREEHLGEGEAKHILDRLVTTTRLVRRDYNRGTTTYEIVSEFLVPWIRTLKLQRAARTVRNSWLKRAGAVLFAVALVLSGVFYWKYSALTRDQLVQQAREEAAEQARQAGAARDQAAEARREATRLGAELKRLQETLRLSGNEREQKLNDDLQRQSAELDIRQATISQLDAQVRAGTTDRERLNRENEARQKEANTRIGELETRVSGLEADRGVLQKRNEELTALMGRGSVTPPPNAIPAEEASVRDVLERFAAAFRDRGHEVERLADVFPSYVAGSRGKDLDAIFQQNPFALTLTNVMTTVLPDLKSALALATVEESLLRGGRLGARTNPRVQRTFYLEKKENRWQIVSMQ